MKSFRWSLVRRCAHIILHFRDFRDSLSPSLRICQGCIENFDKKLCYLARLCNFVMASSFALENLQTIDSMEKMVVEFWVNANLFLPHNNMCVRLIYAPVLLF